MRRAADSERSHERRSEQSRPATTRRRVLRAAGAAGLAAVAGCSTARDDPASGTTAAETTPTGPATEPPATTPVETATPEPTTVPERVADRAVPVGTLDPAADVGDLRPLADALADARIVGLGESTHGARELFRLKHRLIRLLVVELDLRLVALEANFSETLAVDEYVTTGRGDPVAALAGVYYWPWYTESMLALVEWLRAFNAGRPPGDRVRFYGVDMNYARGPARALRAFLGRVDPGYLATVRADLDTLAGGGLRGVDDATLRRRIRTTDRLLADLGRRLDDRAGDYAAAASRRAVGLARRHHRVLEQTLAAARARLADDAARYHAVRDRAMAENASWALAFESADRMALWGHNSHVARGTLFGSVTATGGHLARRHGGRYYPLGLEFGRGAVQAVPSLAAETPTRHAVGAPPAGSVPAVLADVSHPRFVLPFGAATADPALADWLGEHRRVHDIGAAFDPDRAYERLVPAEAFDGLGFVRTVERARPLGGGTATPAIPSDPW